MLSASLNKKIIYLSLSRYPEHQHQLSGLTVCDSELVGFVSLLVNEREECVVASKNLLWVGANPVPTSPLADDLATAPSRQVLFLLTGCERHIFSTIFN